MSILQPLYLVTVSGTPRFEGFAASWIPVSIPHTASAGDEVFDVLLDGEGLQIVSFGSRLPHVVYARCATVVEG